MRTWGRISQAAGGFCGFCDALLERGQAVQFVQLKTIQRELVRCPKCAGESVPEDLPELGMERSEPVKREAMTRIGSLSVEQLVDFKQKASGD